jgi:glycosyltransferase involved in cell wall biosynthesis
VIVFAVPDFEPAVGGTTRQTRLQADALARRGYDVVVLTRRIDAALARHERLRGLDVVRVGPAGRSALAEKRALASLGRWLRAHRGSIDVFQIVMWPDAIFAAAAAGLTGRTAVLWAIEGEIGHTLRSPASPARRVQARARRRLLGQAEHVTLTSRMASEFGEVGLDASNTVIPVPVDRSHFRPPTEDERRAVRAESGLEADAFVVLYVGHLQARKAVDRLISAVDLIRNHIPALHLLIVGGTRGAPDDTEIALRRQVADRGLDEVVTFCGVDPDPRRYLWAADVLALPSEREGMPNSLLEALASGVPAVAPPSAGGDHVLDEDTGVVPPSNEPEAIAAALERLRDNTVRERMGNQSRVRSERYDVEVIADAYVRLYERMTAR